MANFGAMTPPPIEPYPPAPRSVPSNATTTSTEARPATADAPFYVTSGVESACWLALALTSVATPVL